MLCWLGICSSICDFRAPNGADAGEITTHRLNRDSRDIYPLDQAFAYVTVVLIDHKCASASEALLYTTDDELHRMVKRCRVVL